MKASYFGYYVYNNATQTRSLIDIRPFLRKFCSFSNPEYKNQFRHQDEHVYLIPNGRSSYLLLLTRNNEIIKSINSEDFSVNDISAALDRRDQVSFASYIMLRGTWLGIASTVLAPRIGTFGRLVNDIFSTVNLSDYEFSTVPFMQEATKADALSMDFLGATTVQVSNESNIFNELKTLITATDQDFTDVDSFEIKLKPKPRRNIKDAAIKLINSAGENGVDRLVVRAKEQVAEQLTDLYLFGQGAVHDSIDARNERTIVSSMATKAVENSVLGEKIQAHEADSTFTQIPIGAIDDIANGDLWPGVVLRV